MGLFKDLIKIGFGGVVASSVISGAIAEAKRTEEERTNEKLLWFDDRFEFKRVLKIPAKNLDKIYEFIKNNTKKSGFDILEENKPYYIQFKKGNLWTGIQKISINLEKIEGKILFSIISKFGLGSIPQGKDRKEFFIESETISTLIEDLFKK